MMTVPRYIIRKMLIKASKRAKEIRGFPLLHYAEKEARDLLVVAFTLAQTEHDGRFGKALEAEYEKRRHLMTALAIHLLQSKDLEQAGLPFCEVDEVIAWLDGAEESDFDPEYYFRQSTNFFERTVWSLIGDAEEQLNVIWKERKHLHREHWNHEIDTKSTMPDHIVRFVFDLSTVWARFVDPTLGLPRRDPNPDNPLLRFVRLGVETLVGSDCPPNKTLHTVIHDHIRPQVLADERERKERAAAEEEARRVELGDDPFALKLHGDGD